MCVGGGVRWGGGKAETDRQTDKEGGREGEGERERERERDCIFLQANMAIFQNSFLPRNFLPIVFVGGADRKHAPQALGCETDVAVRQCSITSITA